MSLWNRSPKPTVAAEPQKEVIEVATPPVMPTQQDSAIKKVEHVVEAVAEEALKVLVEGWLKVAVPGVMPRTHATKLAIINGIVAGLNEMEGK
jgi:hypothetical protein